MVHGWLTLAVSSLVSTWPKGRILLCSSMRLLWSNFTCWKPPLVKTVTYFYKIQLSSCICSKKSVSFFPNIILGRFFYQNTNFIKIKILKSFSKLNLKKIFDCQVGESLLLWAHGLTDQSFFGFDHLVAGLDPESTDSAGLLPKAQSAYLDRPH